MPHVLKQSFKRTPRKMVDKTNEREEKTLLLREKKTAKKRRQAQKIAMQKQLDDLVIERLVVRRTKTAEEAASILIPIEKKIQRLRDKLSSQEEKTEALLKKKQVAEDRKQQEENKVRNGIAKQLEHKLEALRTRPGDKADRIIISLKKELARLRRKKLGSRPKDLRRLAHIENMAMTLLMHTSIDAYKQKKMRRHLSRPKNKSVQRKAKVIDLNLVRRKVQRHFERNRKRDVNKIFEFLERIDTDPIRSLLTLMSDAGIKQIPTDMWSDPSMSFNDIVYELVVKYIDDEHLPIRKYQKIALNKRA